MVSVYMPPGGSQQLHESPIAGPFQLMSDAASDALKHGYYSLGGGFSAKVAGRNDISGSGMMFLKDSVMIYYRGMSSPRENVHGRTLLIFARGPFLLLGTGRHWGTEQLQPHISEASLGAGWTILPCIDAQEPMQLIG